MRLWNDEHWSRLRERDGIPIGFLEDPSAVGPFKHGGGKGGDLMAFSKDGQFIIKGLNKGDHQSLLCITASYVQRIWDGKTLLCTFYMHYTETLGGAHYVVMRNILIHRGPYVGLYDLKGCADDKTLEAQGRKVKTVHKRFWHLHMWCGECAWSDDRVLYHRGKVTARGLAINLTDEQRVGIVERLRLDTEWLAANSLMDYSLLVGMRRMSQEELEKDVVARWAHRAPPGELRQPMLHLQGSRKAPEVMAVYIGIIDFLQAWTLSKKIAMALKALERNKATIPPIPYGKRFLQHFTRNIQGGAVAVDPPQVLPDEEHIGGVLAPLLERAVSDGAVSFCSTADMDALTNGVESPLCNNGQKGARAPPRFGWAARAVCCA